MKKKLLITSSLITILLALFPVSLYAEEVVQDPAPASTSDPRILLDSYFYQNYSLLPFIEADSDQYIDTGIKGSNDLKIELKVSDIDISNADYAKILFGSRISSSSGKLYIYVGPNSLNQTNSYSYNFDVSSYSYNSDILPYNVNYLKIDKNKCYINNNLIHIFNDSDFNNNLNLYIFNLNNNGSVGSGFQSHYKLYSFSIYDYSLDLNNEEVGYVRYYYPAKAKSSGVIGLYDAISKTFVTTLGSDPFESPTDDQVIGFQISDFITSGLTWIGDILDFAIETPIILFFMAVGLAGAMYRWARKLVHF